MNLSINYIKKADLNLLSHIYCEVYSKVDVNEKWTPETAFKMLSYWYEKQPDLSYLAKVDRKIVGAFLVGVKPWWDGNVLYDGEIFVLPKYQKLGIGSKLLKTVLIKAKEKYNVKKFDTYTFRNLQFPLTWYKNIGFKEIEEWTMISGDIDAIINSLN